MRNCAIGENKKKKDVKKLNEDNASMKQMVDGVTTAHEEKLKLNEIEFENFKIRAAEAEACAEIVMKDEHNKEIEREKYQNSINKLKINHNQASIELKEKQTEIITLKKVLETNT